MDYVITVATLCEMISQAYEKMALHQQRQQQQRLQQNQHHLGSNHPYNDFPIWNAASLDLFGKIDSRFKVWTFCIESRVMCILLNEEK
jgi:hypothetical protein